MVKLRIVSEDFTIKSAKVFVDDKEITSSLIDLKLVMDPNKESIIRCFMEFLPTELEVDVEYKEEKGE